MSAWLRLALSKEYRAGNGVVEPGIGTSCQGILFSQEVASGDDSLRVVYMKNNEIITWQEKHIGCEFTAKTHIRQILICKTWPYAGK